MKSVDLIKSWKRQWLKTYSACFHMSLPLILFCWLNVTLLLLSLDITETLGGGFSVPTIEILILKITSSNLAILFVKLLIISISENISSMYLHFQEFWCPYTWICSVNIVLYFLKLHLKNLLISTFWRRNLARRVGRIPRVSSVLPWSRFVNTLSKYRAGSGQQLTLLS